MMKPSILLLAGTALMGMTACRHVQPQVPDRVTFSAGSGPWKLPADTARIVRDPEDPDNSVLRIDATAPHHTIVGLADGAAPTDFLLTLRTKVLDWQNSAPVIYLYGRRGTDDGFRGLQFDTGGCEILCWKGRETPATKFGGVTKRLSKEDGWVRLAFACYGGFVTAKIWADGSPEPRWQIEGIDEDQPEGNVGFGVWTSPKESSPATVLFDDVRLVPLDKGNLAALDIHPEPRQSLPVAAIPAAAGCFQADNRVGLRSTNAALVFDSRNGDITDLVDLATGQQFILQALRSPLFRLQLSKPYANEHTGCSARDFQTVKVRRKGSRTVELQFSDHIALPIAVRATATLADDDAIALRLHVDNRTDWCVANASFPEMPAPAALAGDGTSDHLLLPWASGGLLAQPGQTFQKRGSSYPGAMFAQFYVHYSNRAGLYVGAHDSAGHCKRLQLHCEPGRVVDMTFEHLWPMQPGKDVSLPYDVVIRTYRGDWRDGADIYRSWAEQQPWCGPKLRDRDDIPQFLKDGAGIIISGIQNPAGREKQFGANMERLPEVLDAYREATGLKHMVFVPYGWENRGTWAGINYFPAIPSNECWQNINKTLKKRGHRTAFLTSAFWWVVRRQKTNSGPAFDDTADFEKRSDMCVQTPAGEPWAADLYERTKKHGSWRGYSATLCHGSREALDTMRDIFLEVARLDVPLVSFDQEIGGGQHAPCYSRDHGHPPGYGAWMWEGFRDVCAEILREGKPIQPELGLFMENASELAIPYMATYWSRQFGEIDVGARGARGIALFSYLYHDYVTAIGAACVQGQGKLGVRADSLLRCRVMANNLTRGLIPGPFMGDVPLEGGSAWQRHVSQAYQSYCKPYAHFPEYLMLGRTRRPPAIACDTVETFFYRQDNKNGKPLRKNGPPVVKESLTLNSVTAGTFEAEDGSRATFVVNGTPEPQQAVVRFAGTQAKTISVFGATREPQKTVAAERVNTEGVSLDLPPFAVRVLLQKAD